MRRLVLLLTGFLLLALAPPVHAATMIGDSTTPPSSQSDTFVGVQLVGGGQSYVAPFAGVLTSVSAAAVGTSPTPSTVRVLAIRLTSGGARVVSGADVVVSSSSTGAVSAPARIPVQTGDHLGVFVPSTAKVGQSGAAGGVFATSSATTPPADGATLTPNGVGVGLNTSVSAVLEPDADGDGYGDESQDACPTAASITTGPCVTDLRVTAVASPARIARGEAATVVATVTNAGSAPAPATRTALTVPAGLRVLAASTTGGECTGTTCDLGDLAAGGTRKVHVVVRGARAGAASVGFAVSSATTEATPADNGAGASVIVTAGTTTGAVRLCTVPRLKGKTRTAARKALKRAGCKAGKARGKGRVRSQTIPAKVRVVAGTKVGFRLRPKQ